MTDDDGQAMVIAVLLLALSATVILGLRAAQDHIVAADARRRAGEAAVEAATAVIADTYVDELRRAALASPAAAPDVARAIADAGAVERARAAANELSLRNRGPIVSSVAARCNAGSVTVALVVAGTTYRAGFEAPECSPR